VKPAPAWGYAQEVAHARAFGLPLPSPPERKPRSHATSAELNLRDRVFGRPRFKRVDGEWTSLCPQCANRKPWPEAFIGLRGAPTKRCRECAKKYQDWASLSTEEKFATAQTFESDDAYSVRFVLRSLNRKLGPIPVSQTARGSCPDSCSFKNAGCFAERNFTRIHWEKVPEEGMSWLAFCREVKRLKRRTLWRHNEAGDLPGEGDAIDPAALKQLVDAAAHTRGFTFTHKAVLESKPVSPRTRALPTAQARALWIPSNRRAIAYAVRRGFTINLSADNLAQADELARLAIAPVAVVLPADAPDRAQKTPDGRQVVVCPSESRGLTCANCQLCAHPQRASIIGFKAHGQSKALVTEIVRTRRSA
jgi:hypothetical protein